MARIEINNLTKEFGTLTALDSVALELEKGQIVGLLGPNGSGKTTLIKILNGLLTPTAGNVLINGMEPGVETKRVVAYLPDRNALPDYMNTQQLIELQGREHGSGSWNRHEATDEENVQGYERKASAVSGHGKGG